MARIITDGAEMGDAILFASTSGSFTASTAQKRSGAYSYVATGTGTGTIVLDSALSEFYFRVGFRTASVLAGRIISWFKGATELGSLRINASSSKLELYTGTSTLRATGTTVIQISTWYLLEVHVVIADAGTLELKVEGLAVEATFSGDTKPGTDADVDRTVLGGLNTGPAFDDIALNSTSGGSDNSWCGDGHIVALYPNDNGDAPSTAQLVGQDADSTDNYLNVDEVPNDGDTTYNESGTADNYDLYKVTDHDNSIAQTILRVWIEARAKDTVAAGGNCQVGYKSTTEHWSSDIPLLTTYTKRVLSAEATVNADGGAAFTDADLDGIQIGFKAR